MTRIEWTHLPGHAGETWNPIVGCSLVSPGCSNCYAMRFAALRLDHNRLTPHYAGTTMRTSGGDVWTGKIAKAPQVAHFSNILNLQDAIKRRRDKADRAHTSKLNPFRGSRRDRRN